MITETPMSLMLYIYKPTYFSIQVYIVYIVHVHLRFLCVFSAWNPIKLNAIVRAKARRVTKEPQPKTLTDKQTCVRCRIIHYAQFTHGNVYFMLYILIHIITQG